NAEAVKILIFAAEGLTKRSAVGFLLRSLIMFQTFISRHNSNFFSDKLVLTSVTPASSAPVLQTPKATSSTRSEERFSRNAETDLVCRLLLEKKKQRLRQLAYVVVLTTTATGAARLTRALVHAG